MKRYAHIINTHWNKLIVKSKRFRDLASRGVHDNSPQPVVIGTALYSTIDLEYTFISHYNMSND